jgi:hypothetical protein
MISDKVHAIEMRMFDLERMLDKAKTDEDRNTILAKIKHMEDTRERLCDEYENIDIGITNILTGPMKAALAPPSAPPGIICPSMPPPLPPTPLTPAMHHTNVPPPTPTPTPLVSNGKHPDPSVDDSSPTKRQKTINAPTRSSPRNLGTCPARTSSESSVENETMPKNPKRTKKVRSLSVTMGSDVFGPTNVNTLVIDEEEMAEVGNIPTGDSIITDVTCHVHPAPRMMLPSHFSAGYTGLCPVRIIPMPKIPVEHNFNVLRVDAGCTAGLNISHFPLSLRTRFKIPRILLWVGLMVGLIALLQPVAVMPSHAPTLSIYALNTNGFVSPTKIHHVNNVIHSRRPHIFVISETKTSAKMGSKLSSIGYNVYEETGIRCMNHHISKWGIIVGIRSDIQIYQPVGITHASLNGRVVAIDIVLGTTTGKGFIHRIIGAYAPWNPGVDDGDCWTQVAKIC